MRAGARSGSRQSRSVVALVVLTAWFGSLLIAAPTQPASAGSPAPSTSAGTPGITSGPAATGSDASPTWTFTLPADVPATTVDPVVSPTGDTSTATISVTHRAECAVDTAAPSAPTDYVACATPAGGAQEFSFQPTLATDGVYRLYVHDVATTSTSTYTEYANGDPPTTTPSTSVDTGVDTVSADYAYAAAGPSPSPSPTATPSATPTASVSPSPTPTAPPAPDAPSFVSPATTGGPAQSFALAPGVNGDPVLDTLSCAIRAAGDASAPSYSTCTSPYAPFAAEPSGTYDVFVRTDRAGAGSSAPSTVTFVLDATGPVLTLFSGPTTPGNDPAPRWTVTADGGEPVSCTLTGAAATATVFLAGTCAPYAPGVLADDTWTLTATATDDAGNTTTASMATYVLDQAPPTISVTAASTTSTTSAVGWTVAVGAGGLTPTCVLTEASQATGETFAASTDCAQFAAFTLPREGSFTLTATTLDTAGNSASAAGSTFYRAAPVVAVTSAAAGNGTSNSWAVSAPSTADLTCSVQRIAPLPAGASAAVTPCASGAVPVTLADGEGTYRFTAVVRDPVTGASASAYADFLWDTTPLPDFAVTGTSGDTSSTAVSWAWDPTGSASSSCQLRKDGLPSGTPVTGCTSPWTTPLTADATWSLEVTLYDAAGNATTSTGPEVRLDRLTPSAPGVTVTGLGLSARNDRTPTWTLSGEVGARYVCTWTTTAAPLPSGMPADGTCANPLAPTLPNVTGTYTLTVTQSDAAGNTSTPASTTYQLDVTAPLVTFASQPAGPVNAVPAGTAWTTSGEAGAVSRCTLVRSTPLGDATLYADQACGRSIPVTDAGEGSYVLTVVDRDTAGNDSTPLVSDAWVIDRSNPGAPSISASSPLSPSQSPSATWTVTANDPSGKDFVCRYDTADAATGVFSTTGAFSTCGPVVTWNLPADGTYRVAVQSRDAAGNLSDAVVLSDPYVLDRQAPAPVVFTSAAGTGNTASAAWSWTGESGAAATCQLQRNAVPVSGSAGSFHSCASPQTEALADGQGSYTLLVRLTDAALNTNAAIRGPAYTYDTDPPVVTFVGQPAGPVNAVPAGTAWTTSGETGATSTCTLVWTAAGTPTTVYADQACGRTILVTDAGEGTYVLTVVDRDLAGNDSAPLVSAVWEIDRTSPDPPSISASTPLSPSQSTSATWTVTANDPTGSGFVCRYDTADPVTGVFGTGGSFSTCGPVVTWSFPADGTYRVAAKARDDAGNVSSLPVLSDPYVLDRQAPAPAVFTSTSGTGFTTSSTWAWTGETGAAATCQLQRNAVPVSGAAGSFHACTSPQTEALDAGDGSYTLLVRLTDAALNTNAAVRGPAYDLDTVKPDAPLVTGPSGPSKQTGVSWTYTTTETVTPALLCQLSQSATATSTATIARAVRCLLLPGPHPADADRGRLLGPVPQARGRRRQRQRRRREQPLPARHHPSGPAGLHRAAHRPSPLRERQLVLHPRRRRHR